MKHLIFLLFALCLPLLSMGQTPTNIKADTIILFQAPAPEDWAGGFVSSDTIWYAKREITFRDGRQESKTEPVGNTETVVNYFKNTTLDEARQTGNAMAISLLRQEVVRAGRVRHKALQAAGIGDLYALLDTITWKTYLKPNVANFVQDYTVEQNGSPFGATMRRMANGNVRLTFNGTNYRCLLYSENWIRVRDYPSAGSYIDLARTDERKWKSLSGTNNGVKLTPTLVLIRAKN